MGPRRPPAAPAPRRSAAGDDRGPGDPPPLPRRATRTRPSGSCTRSASWRREASGTSWRTPRRACGRSASTGCVRSRSPTSPSAGRRGSTSRRAGRRSSPRSRTAASVPARVGGPPRTCWASSAPRFGTRLTVGVRGTSRAGSTSSCGGWSEPLLANELAGFAEHVDVLAPEPVRRQLARLGTALARAYGPGRGPGGPHTVRPDLSAASTHHLTGVGPAHIMCRLSGEGTTERETTSPGGCA